MDNFWYRREYSVAGDKHPLADLFFIDSDLWLLKDSKVQELGRRQSAWLAAHLKNSGAPV